MMACIFAMLCLLILPIAFLVYIIAYFKSAPRFKRTHKGKLYTQEITGMKNFIHDYNNLSQVEKEQIPYGMNFWYMLLCWKKIKK